MFDNGFKRVACLDIHSPLYVWVKSSLLGVGDIASLESLLQPAAQAGFRLIQLTPIQDTGLEPCPYVGKSIFSFNPIFADLAKVCSLNTEEKEQALKIKSLSKKGFAHYKKIYLFKKKVFRRVFEESNWCLPDNIEPEMISYSVYDALGHYFRLPWYRWPRKYKKGNPAKIFDEAKQKNQKLYKEILFSLFVQETMRQQWHDLREKAHKFGVHIAIDKPIYPEYDSADVWANQGLFYLNKDGSLKYISGCNNPHDPFGAQKWGHAVYKFKERPKAVIDFYIRSIRHLVKIAKTIRLDHTLALVWKYYLINPETNYGWHEPAIGKKLFSALKEEFPDVLFIAEDVGFSSPKYIDRPLSRYGIPGIRSPQWSNQRRYAQFGKYPENCVAMTSNHDLPSLSVWWQKLTRREKVIFERQAGQKLDAKDGYWRVLEMIFGSLAKIASVSLQDLVGDMRRYNLPGRKNHQNWRLIAQTPLEDVKFDTIKKAIEKSDRN